MSSVVDRLDVLTELFLGAAYADQHLAGRERQHINDLVRDLSCASELPAWLSSHIDAFNPRAFDLKAAASRFSEDPPMSRRRLLELVAQVTAADGVFDLAEDEYLRALARELNMPDSEVADLTLDYEVEHLRESFEQLRRPKNAPPATTPPPLPAST